MSANRGTRRKRGAATDAEAQLPSQKVQRKQDALQKMQADIEAHSKAIEQLQTLPASIEELKTILLNGQASGDQDDMEQPPFNQDELAEGSTDPASLAFDIFGKDDDEGVSSAIIDETESELLDVLSQIQEESNYGPPIRPQIAKSFSCLLNKATSKEEQDKWKMEFQTPENCKLLTVPRVNPEIWSALPAKLKQRDLSLQQLQSLIISSTINLANVAEKVLEMGVAPTKEAKTKLLGMLLQSASLNAAANREINIKRKQEIRPALSKEASSICSSGNVTTEFLFGDNVSEAIKSSKSMANLLKPSGTKPKMYNARTSGTFNSNRLPSQGNFRRTFSMTSRGGPQSRPFQRPFRRPQMKFQTTANLEKNQQ